MEIDNGYHQRSLAETDMDRYKQFNSPMLSLRDYNGQVAEALAGVKAMNKVIRLVASKLPNLPETLERLRSMKWFNQQRHLIIELSTEINSHI